MLKSAKQISLAFAFVVLAISVTQSASLRILIPSQSCPLGMLPSMPVMLTH